MTLSHFRTVWVSFLAQGWFSHLTCGAWCYPSSLFLLKVKLVFPHMRRREGIWIWDDTFHPARFNLYCCPRRSWADGPFFFFCPFFLPVESSCHLTVLLKSQRGLWSADLDWVWKRKQQHLKWRCRWVWFLFLYSVSLVTLGAHAQVYQVACFFQISNWKRSR